MNTISLTIFCLLVLSILEREALTVLTVTVVTVTVRFLCRDFSVDSTVDFSVSPSSSISFYFMYFETVKGIMLSIVIYTLFF